MAPKESGMERTTLSHCVQYRYADTTICKVRLYSLHKLHVYSLLNLMVKALFCVAIASACSRNA